ncbi:hypothetical protein HMPREF9296_1274 [Prevotella disiens FB035-09AN]|uniref:Uncharacterized protein n=1 Tax=Prevotella disiens FB035-09AN TaxID=866771 RepID=E1KMI4_9BACT|nr:hypothetical protein HMPREF9296_1274 [Prevotella disiens FB035-09AN]
MIPSSLKKENNGQICDKVDIGKGDIKQQVSSIVRAVLKHYTFCSLGELNAILSRYNLAVEEVKAEYRGKRYDGLVYVPADNKGNKVSTPIHAHRTSVVVWGILLCRTGCRNRS